MVARIIYRGYSIERTKDGWEVIKDGVRRHVTVDQNDAMEWCDLQRKIASAQRNAV